MTPHENQRIREALQVLSVDRGDDDAWRALVEVTFSIAMATANRILRGALDLAKDASWEAFGRIARYADFELLALNEPGAFQHYLKQVTRRTSYDLLRSLALRSPEFQSGLVDLEGVIQSGDPTPEAAFAADELRSDILKMLEPEEQRLLNLVLEGYTLPEIADRLQISYTSAGVRVHRLRGKIRKHLKTEGL
jgi:RNA polymerase sigma factor (sigma-70 family)